MKTWLITGGCGFIGRNLVKKLIANDDANILVLDNLSVGSLNALREISELDVSDLEAGFNEEFSKLTFVKGDILDKEIVNFCAEKADYIIHLAANTGVAPSVKDPFYDCHTNILGTLNLLDAAKEFDVERFIFASSGAPLGAQSPPLHEELATKPASPYGASKLAGEGYCSAYYHSFNVNTVCLRFGNVYGGLSETKDSIVAKFIKCSFSGVDFEIYGNGNQTRDFIYIEDLISAIISAVRAPNVGGEVFQIASAKELSVNELIVEIQSALMRYNLNAVNIVDGEVRVGDVMRNYSNTTKANKLLNWEALETIETGLEKTVMYFKHNLGE